MQWRKASEILPEKKTIYHIRLDNGGIGCFDFDGKVFNNGEIDFINERIFWLDESDETPTTPTVWPGEDEIQKVAEDNYGWDNEKYGATWNQVREEQKKAFYFAIEYIQTMLKSHTAPKK